MKTTIALLALILPGISHGGCKELVAAVEAAQKEISAIEVAGMNDTSRDRGAVNAAVENTRQLRIANQLASIQANLLILDRAKCQLPTEPITAGEESAYVAAAARCAAPGRSSEACQRDTWKRGQLNSR
jgi:hypothetical protein